MNTHLIDADNSYFNLPEDQERGQDLECGGIWKTPIFSPCIFRIV